MTRIGQGPAMISVIIPAHNNSNSLGRVLEAVAASKYSHYEVIVVDDGSTDASRDIAKSSAARVLELPKRPYGPAYARNRGAEMALGDVLLFVDADVVVCPDTLAKVADTFARHPEIAAMFGSYDDHPEAMDFVSRYKNLFHHFVHQQAREDAVTFWSGCGAVRRNVFFEMGGFDEASYPRPSIEDVDLGYRLRAAGHKVALNKQIQVQHLKRWSLTSIIKSDIIDRGIPWAQLVLRTRSLPNDLNLRFSQRVSAFLLIAVLLYLGLTAFFHNAVILPLLAALSLLLAGNWSEGTPHFDMTQRAKVLTYILAGSIGGLALYSGLQRMIPLLAVLVFAIHVDRWLPRADWLWRRILFSVVILALVATSAFLLKSFSIRFAAPLLLVMFLIVLINHRFYVFFAQKQGLLFTLAVVPFHLFYYLYSMTAFAFGIGIYVWKGRQTKPNVSYLASARAGHNPAEAPGFVPTPVGAPSTYLKRPQASSEP